ncbi:Nucleoside 2-deoxyribosyltransferase [Parageobacillus caldoxylosilyticus]|uniref:nucleoside 2-deoxyribosyltransferase n=1 Tax=Saccharococcus caldoxylosilyticus TaxID=81408 RepID=UPI001C4DDA60|nr:nucleoside 2-deoxyribosyltransferase [Parageobacillus caldoxylosilyticus]QXJ40447.1 Nucleoside 2-deoxyribosyltransferase [Parageobacillus caldoxylosilyticus]
MKFYIASSFKNIDAVRYVSEKLKSKGFIHTYDWTQNERASTIEQLKEIGQREKEGVMEADFLIVLLPAGKGSHIEFGIALGHGKKIYLYSPNDDVNNFETTSTFYHLPEVEKCIGTLEELVDIVSVNSRVY